jgi:ribulose-5-phosphate 4-epimerase/fuculose-1-phosphate aldolase
MKLKPEIIKQREVYCGVKFQPECLGVFVPNAEEKKAITQMIALGHELGKMDIKDKNGGNLSRRVARGMVIKNTGAYPYALKLKDFSLVTEAKGEQVAYYGYGSSAPSSEARLHFEIYKKYPGIKTVVHCHDFDAVYSRIKILGIGYLKPIEYGTLKSARAVSRLAAQFDYIVQENHGVIAFGRNFRETLNLIKKYHAKFIKINSFKK